MTNGKAAELKMFEYKVRLENTEREISSYIKEEAAAVSHEPVSSKGQHLMIQVVPSILMAGVHLPDSDERTVFISASCFCA